jgi:hypothetical protein
MKEKIQLLDVVVLAEALPQERLKRGSIGTVVEVFDDDNFLVEFADANGVAYSMVALKTEQLIKVFAEPVPA